MAMMTMRALVTMMLLRSLVLMMLATWDTGHVGVAGHNVSNDTD